MARARSGSRTPRPPRSSGWGPTPEPSRPGSRWEGEERTLSSIGASSGSSFRRASRRRPSQSLLATETRSVPDLICRSRRRSWVTRSWGTRGLMRPSPAAPSRIVRVVSRPVAERAGLDPVEHVHEGRFVPLQDAREDVGAEEGLVAVDADRPDARVGGGLHGPEPAGAGDVEDDAGSSCDLTAREGRALRTVDEVVGVVDEDLYARRGSPGPGGEAVDEVGHRGHLPTAHDADDVRSRPSLLELRGQPPGEERGLARLEHQTRDVRRRVLHVGARAFEDDERHVRVTARVAGGRPARNPIPASTIAS